jgi:hypothetical protein
VHLIGGLCILAVFIVPPLTRSWSSVISSFGSASPAFALKGQVAYVRINVPRAPALSFSPSPLGSGSGFGGVASRYLANHLSRMFEVILKIVQ